MSLKEARAGTTTLSIHSAYDHLLDPEELSFVLVYTKKALPVLWHDGRTLQVTYDISSNRR